MPGLGWLYLSMSLRIVVLIYISFIPIIAAFAQSPPGRDPEPMATKARRDRDEWRAQSQQLASLTCGNRGRYDGDMLLLNVDRRVVVFRDRIEIEKHRHSEEMTFHTLRSCDDKLDLYVADLMRIGEGDVPTIGRWVDFWVETILVQRTPGMNRVRWLGAPISSPDEKAIASCKIVPMANAHQGIHIAVRDSEKEWIKLWHHVPHAVSDCEFLTWETSNRFRVLMRDGSVWRDGNQWESVIEFTSTTLSRTDGPKTPAKRQP